MTQLSVIRPIRVKRTRRSLGALDTAVRACVCVTLCTPIYRERGGLPGVQLARAIILQSIRLRYVEYSGERERGRREHTHEREIKKRMREREEKFFSSRC